MTDMTPEQEAAAIAALEEKEVRARARVIQVKLGAIERNSMPRPEQPTQTEIVPEPAPKVRAGAPGLWHSIKSLFKF